MESPAVALSTDLFAADAILQPCAACPVLVYSAPQPVQDRLKGGQSESLQNLPIGRLTGSSKSVHAGRAGPSGATCSVLACETAVSQGGSLRSTEVAATMGLSRIQNHRAASHGKVGQPSSQPGITIRRPLARSADRYRITSGRRPSQRHGRRDDLPGAQPGERAAG